MSIESIDVIIPCYNAAATLNRAVKSVLAQPQLGTLWLIDDGSTDQTAAIAQEWAAQHPQRIRVETLPQNGGAARARNWGALLAQNETIAFLDADDAYQARVLEAAAVVFNHRPVAGLLRLPMNAVNLPPRYADHPDIQTAWRMFEMTGAGNTVFNRAFFLACGGFPQDELFRRLGGEDGALGLATIASSAVATLFDDVGFDQISVNIHCRPGMFAERLFDAMLFGQAPEHSEDDRQQAEAVTAEISRRLGVLRGILNPPQTGKMPLRFTPRPSETALPEQS